ncbi:MAG: diguanylate cyclase [Campylobacterales bacterium]
MVNIKECMDPICGREAVEVQQMTIKEIAQIAQKCESVNFYILHRKLPVHVFSLAELLDLCLKGEGDQNVIKFIKTHRKNIPQLPSDINIFDAYNEMRRQRWRYAVIVQEGDAIGEVDFKILALRIIDVLIKDPMTGVFNYHYFNILIERYPDIGKPMGLIFIEIDNLDIIERFQGGYLVQKILKKVAEVIDNSVRDIDFIFRIDNRFAIIIFQPLEVTKKVEMRLQERLKGLTVEGLEIKFRIAYSHVPEIRESILTAIDDCERKLLRQMST